MEKIDLSTNARKIEDAYLKVVRNEGINFLVITVDSNAVADISDTGFGDLNDFIENFTDGHVQFGLARVNVPGSDVYKNLLLGWCPANARIKARMAFASNFADIASVLVGYHVQITARDQDDLDVNEFLSRVSAAAGARYSIQSQTPLAKPIARPLGRDVPVITPKPAATPAKPAKPAAKPVGSKPAYVPRSTGNPINIGTKPPKPAAAKPQSTESNADSKADSDDWDGEEELEERDFEKKPLEDVPSAYKPTKVDIDLLRKQKSDTISSQPKAPAPKETAEPELELQAPQSFSDRMSQYKKNEEPSDGRLTSLPKHKTSKAVSSRFTPAAAGSSGPSFGAKPVVPPTVNRNDQLVTDKRDFASENGKTPAQIWAEKRGKYKTVLQEVDEVADGVEKVAIEPETEESEPVEEAEEAEETEEADEAENPAEPEPKTPSLPVRNLPPPPVRNVQKAPEPVPEPEPESEPESAPASSAPAASASAIAEYSYEKDEDNEIGFEEGDLIVEIDFVDDDWWSGKHSKSGEVGLFPSSYVVLQESDSKAAAPEPEASPAPPALPRRESAKLKPSATAEYAYEKDEDNEIDFEEGDVIVDIEFVDEDWWSGKHSKSGETGLFPANYVKLNN